MERIILEGGFGNHAWAVTMKADSDRRGAECDVEVSVYKCGDEHLVSTWRGTARRRKDAGRVVLRVPAPYSPERYMVA